MDLIRQLEDHWIACMASAGSAARVTRLPGAVVVTNEEWSGPLANFIAVRGARTGGLAPILEAGSALLLQRNTVPTLFLTPEPGDREGMEQELRRLGWALGSRQHVLCRSLDRPPAQEGAEPEVEAIDPGTLAAWARLMTRAYGLAGPRARQVRSVWTALAGSPGEGAAAIPVWARIEGRPVGTGLVWVQGTTAGLYCGAVMIRYRRRGVETATLRFRLQAAADAGAKLAYLQTEVGSAVERICLERLGFRVAYERSLWFPLGHVDIVQNMWI